MTTTASRSETVLLGVTGLTGGFVAAKSRQPLTCLVRREPVNLPSHHRWLQFDELELAVWPESVDQVICCLGSTLKKAGSIKAFRQQDYDLPIALFEKALAAGAKRLLMVSSVGADSGSVFPYNRIKGELENTVARQGWQQVCIFRPSLLLGERNESRFFEQISQKLFGRIRALVPATFRPIYAAELADQIVRQAELPIETGQYIIQGNKLWTTN